MVIVVAAIGKHWAVNSSVAPSWLVPARCTAVGNHGHCREFFRMANHPVTGVLTSIGTLTSRPAAFLILLVYAILWMIFERQTLDWHGAATLFTWAMTLFIQRAEHRDTQAIHAKLDEILRSDHNASNITRIDDEEPEEIEKHRHRRQQDD
ncbi:membrane protein [Mesorhizobium sp. L2C089B000]|nr:membrane protein [Mesorhizobium sp. L2C089B000]